MKNKVFNVGDVVMLVSGSTTLYTITVLYGNGYSICNYVDQDTCSVAEISIPVVALAKCKEDRFNRHGDPLHYNSQYRTRALPDNH